jgi:type III secretion protein D
MNVNAMNQTTAFELRVLDGTQRGASTAVRSGVPLSLSGAWNSDIVLRSAGLADSGVELLLDGDAVDVLARQGQVQVAGASVPVGSRVRVPLYTPIVIGDTTVALGELGASRWAPLFAGSSGEAATTDTAAAPEVNAARRPWPRWLLHGGGALAAVSLSVLALAMVIKPAPPSPGELALRAQAVLRSAGFNAVAVKPGDGGELVVNGYLETLAQRSRAEQLLAAEGIGARFAVWVDEQVAGAVREVYRLNGVAAEIEAAGPGVVRVKTRLADAAALQRVQDTARRDVAGLTQLVSANQAPAREPSPVPRMDDAGKRVSSIVGGDSPYVVTLDGTRYFAGALLPTGHHIVSIGDREVRLEREGQASTLAF